jgi:hypothetical protein
MVGNASSRRRKLAFEQQSKSKIHQFMIRKIIILITASYIKSAQKPVIEISLQYCLISFDYAQSATSELVTINFSWILLIANNIPSSPCGRLRRILREVQVH